MAVAKFPCAAQFIPPHATLPLLSKRSKPAGCELYLHATQGVLGEGPRHARLILAGEQPGNEEDLAGRPFVGPAGRLLDRALEEAGIERSGVYLTNAAKHFKFEERGKRRIHKKPSVAEVWGVHAVVRSRAQAAEARGNRLSGRLNFRRAVWPSRPCTRRRFSARPMRSNARLHTASSWAISKSCGGSCGREPAYFARRRTAGVVRCVLRSPA